MNKVTRVDISKGGDVIKGKVLVIETLMKQTTMRT